MKGAASLKNFVVAPVGTFLASRTFMLCAPSPQWFVAVHLASLDPSEVPMVGELLGLPNSPGLAPRYDILYDVASVATMDRTTFSLFEDFVRKTIEFLVLRVGRFALVRPVGLPGHMFSGMFHEWLVPRLGENVRMFDVRDSALDWLAVPAGERAELEQTVDSFTGATPTIRAMRDLLADDLSGATLEAVAARLGTSARSLQRHLGSVGTTFREELARARIRGAQALLIDTEAKIESIAAELGFKSLAAFTTSFRTALGETPAAYREHRRQPFR